MVRSLVMLVAVLRSACRSSRQPGARVGSRRPGRCVEARAPIATRGRSIAENRSRAAVPHGDRGDRAESRRIEDHEPGPGRGDRVVRVLDLGIDIEDRAASSHEDAGRATRARMPISPREIRRASMRASMRYVIMSMLSIRAAVPFGTHARHSPNGQPAIGHLPELCTANSDS
jgi:hypothetical protein